MNYLNNWLGLLGIGGLGALGAAAWFFGLSSVLKILATAFDIVSPILKGIVEALVEYVKILWAGFKDVVDSWMTMVFVLSLAVGVWGTMKVYDKVEDFKYEEKIEICNKRVQELMSKNRTCKKW